MRVVFLKKFSRDLDNVSNKNMKLILDQFIVMVEETDSMRNHPNIKKLAGHKNAFRLRIGDYRVGLFITGETVEFVRILHRKEIIGCFLRNLRVNLLD